MPKPLMPAKAMALLVLTLASALVASCATAAQGAQDISLNSFESAQELARLRPLQGGSAIEQSTEHVTDGKHSVRVTFRSAAANYASLRMDLRRQDGSPADWSRFRTLKLDCHNPYHKDRPANRRRSSARIDFSIHDVKRNRIWHGCNLSRWVSDQVLLVPLGTTMNEASALRKRPFDLGAVVDVLIYTKRPAEDLVLFLDNVTLVPQTVPPPGADASARPIPPRVPPRALGRDFVFTQHYHPDYPYEDKGFFRLGKGPVVLRLSQPGLAAASVDLPALLTQVKELRQRQIPFHVILFNFWYGKSETYDDATRRLRGAIAACEAAAGRLFHGVWLHETPAINYYQIVREQTTRLGKANAYVDFLRRFVTDLALPPEKLLVVNRDWFTNYGLDFEAGVDAALPETLFGLDNLALCMAQSRGMARSFGRWCGGDTARYSPDTAPTALYNRDGSAKPAKIDFRWWTPADVYKAFIQHYYSGADILRGQSEWPGRRPEDAEILDHFLRFVQSHPAAGKVISSIAVVRSKGDYWEGAGLVGPGKRLDRDGYRPTDRAKREELDFTYLNTFFPGFSDDVYTAKSFWTGTPYGPIDVIYPAMSLQAMKDYDVVIFMGFHRMDSVRSGFLADLTRYVESGGVVLLAADQLRMSDERFAPAAAVQKLVGAAIAERTRPLTGPIRIAEDEQFRLPLGSYPLPASSGRPAAHEVALCGAVALAADARGLPLLLRHRVGAGCVLLLTTPTLSTLPPAGRSRMVRDLIAALAGRARRPVHISPPSQHLEVVPSRAKDGRAVVFLMNHEREEWAGEVTVDLDKAGIPAQAAPEVSLVVGRGYESRSAEIHSTLRGRRIVIRQVRLPGGSKGFDPYRAASFGVLTIQSR